MGPKKVEVYTLKGCGHSVRAKEILTKVIGNTYIVYEVSPEDKKLNDLKETLKKQSDIDTFPQIFIDGEFYGDCRKLIEDYKKLQGQKKR